MLEGSQGVHHKGTIIPHKLWDLAGQGGNGGGDTTLTALTCVAALAGRARLLALLKPSEGGLLWRTNKADVAHELGLPPQQQHTTTLHFSAIERHFYSRQHAECTSRASSTLPSQLLSQAAQGLAGVGRRRLTAAEEKKLLFPLLRLRQACCHPQVGGWSLPPDVLFWNVTKRLVTS